MLNHIELQQLQHKQAQLDDLIFKLHETNRPKTFINRQLSFLVELAELVNEQRDFKYWSNKPASPQKVLLEEYADGLHFLLSLSIDMQCRFLDPLPGHSPLDPSLSTTHFLMRLFNEFAAFSQKPDLAKYQKVLSLFLELGQRFALESKAIMEAYAAKYIINQQRQQNQY